MAASDAATPPPSPGPVGRGGRRRWVWSAGALAVAMAVALVAWAVWPASDHATTSETPSRQSALPPTRPVIGPNGGELQALLRAGQSARYHARYQVTGEGLAGGTTTLETWNAPPRRRGDTMQRAGGHTVHTETFSDANSATLCSQADAGAWTCGAAQHPQADAVAVLVNAATANQPTSVADGTLDGRKVRCFTLGALKACLTAAGVLASLSDGKSGYRLVALDTHFPAHVFDPPAPIRR